MYGPGACLMFNKWQRLLDYCDCVLSALLGEVPGRKNNGLRSRKPGSGSASSVYNLSIHFTLQSVFGFIQGQCRLGPHSTIQGRCGHHEVIGIFLVHGRFRYDEIALKLIMAFIA